VVGVARFRRREGSFFSFEALESFESRFARFLSSFVMSSVKLESPGDERVEVFRLLPPWYSRDSGLRSGDEGSSPVLCA
jgi:hypothetical protein